MKIYHSAEEFKGCPHPVLTTGTFDGVHIGHKKIIKRLKEIAKRNGGETVMLTFHPHPRMVLFPDDDSLKLLNTQEEKIELLREAGIDHLVIHPFSMEFSRMKALEYVRDLLVNDLKVKTMVVGYDHHFGRNREGNFENLVEFGHIYGFDVEEISALEIDEVNVSSTKIRKALKEGNVKKAATYLGYNYPISGIVAHGDKIGTELGFPTANLNVEDKYKLIPAEGVYAVKVQLRGEEYPGMLNIGKRPTLSDSGAKRIEVNLFNFDDKIYDEKITLRLIDRIRDEQRFDSLELLSAQLDRDREIARAILKA